MVTTAYGHTSHVKPVLDGLPEPYSGHFDDVYQVWSNNLSKNLTRRAYYEGENTLKNIGIAIPDDMANLHTVIGWPRKAVKALAVRSRFDGFTSKTDADAVNAIFEANHFNAQYKRNVVNTLVYGPSFCTVTRGGYGEPAVRLRCYSAVNAACTWNYDLMRIGTGLTVHDVDKYGKPTRYEMYEDDCIVDIVKVSESKWSWAINPHPAGRPLMEPFVYDADVDYPLGHSRITKAVMDITDRAVREAVRMELASELAACPQKYLLGGYKEDQEKAIVGKTKWEMYIGSVQWFTKDKDGEVPKFGQLAQPSMEPHIKIRDSLAAEFSSETDIPIEMLGVPSTTYTSTNSAEAATENLVAAAEDMDDDAKNTLATIGRLALAVAGNTTPDALTDEQRDITAMFKPERFLSDAAQADAWTKLAGAVVQGSWLTDSRVFWERQGLDAATIDRLMSDKRRNAAGSRIEQMAAAMAGNNNGS